MIITDNTINPITSTESTETATATETKTQTKKAKAYTMITPSSYETFNSIITKKTASLKSLHEKITPIYFDENEVLFLKESKISRKNGVYVIELDEYKGRTIDLNLESDLTMNLKIAKTENAKELSGKYYLQALALTTAMLRAIRPLTEQRTFTVNVKGDVDVKIGYQARPEHIALAIANHIGKNDLEIAVIFNALLASVGIETSLDLEQSISLTTIKNALDLVK
jgi:hypothetical protein